MSIYVETEMETLHYLLNFVLHLDDHLIAFVTAYGTWTYALLFLIIFCETGIIFSAVCRVILCYLRQVH